MENELTPRTTRKLLLLKSKLDAQKINTNGPLDSILESMKLHNGGGDELMDTDGSGTTAKPTKPFKIPLLAGSAPVNYVTDYQSPLQTQSIGNRNGYEDQSSNARNNKYGGGKILHAVRKPSAFKKNEQSTGEFFSFRYYSKMILLLFS